MGIIEIIRMNYNNQNKENIIYQNEDMIKEEKDNNFVENLDYKKSYINVEDPEYYSIQKNFVKDSTIELPPKIQQDYQDNIPLDEKNEIPNNNYNENDDQYLDDDYLYDD